MTLRDLVTAGASCDPTASSSSAPLSRLTTSVLDAPLGHSNHTPKPSQPPPPQALQNPPSHHPPPFPQPPQTLLPNFLTGLPPPPPPPQSFHNHPQQQQQQQHSQQISHNDFTNFLHKNQNTPHHHHHPPQPHIHPQQHPQQHLPPPQYMNPLAPPPYFHHQIPPPNLPMFFPQNFQNHQMGQATVSPVTEKQVNETKEVEKVEDENLGRFMKEIGDGGAWGGEGLTSLEGGGVGEGEEELISAWNGLRLNGEDGVGGEEVDLLPRVGVEERIDEGFFGIEDREFWRGGGLVLGGYDLEEGVVGEVGVEVVGDGRELVRRAENLREEGRVVEAVKVVEEGLRRGREVLKGWEKVEAWYVLGLAQAECDEDVKALQAFKECCDVVEGLKDGEEGLKRKWLSLVLMEMAVSFTNELDEVNALAVLRKWLGVYGDRDDGVSLSVKEISEGSMAMGGISADLLAKEFEETIERGGAVVPVKEENAPSQSSLYIGLGVLRNLTRDYEKAADAFRRAIAANPQDARLWNKLGATLANGFEASEALRAYRKAVDLSPNFVRAWVNVGTAYANTGDFPRAARYYLKALSMTDKRVNSDAGKIDIAHVWEYLKTTLVAMDRDDLVPLLDRADPEAFRGQISF